MRPYFFTLTFTLTLCLLVSASCSDDVQDPLQWVISAGGDDKETHPINDALAVDAQGNIYITGILSSTTFTLGSFRFSSKGKKDFYVAKISPAGEFLWARHFGGAGDDHTDGLCLDAKGNLYVVGDFSGTLQAGSTTLTAKGAQDLLVASLAPADGKVRWAAQSGSAGKASAWTCDPHPSGGLVVTGFYEQQITLGSTTLSSKGGADIFVARLSSDGKAFSAASSMGGPGDDYVEDLAVGAGGEMYVVGYFKDSLIAGSTTLTSTGDDDLFAAKLSGSGVPQWAIGGGGTGEDRLLTVALDKSGALLVGGHISSSAKLGSATITLEYTGGKDMLMARILSSGAVDWAKAAFGQKTIDGKRLFGADNINDIAMDSEGRVLYTGKYFSAIDFLGQQISNTFAWDVMVARASTRGAADWTASYGGTDDTSRWNSGASIAVDSKGDIIVVGDFLGDVQYGATTLSSWGSWDTFVLKLTPPL